MRGGEQDGRINARSCVSACARVRTRAREPAQARSRRNGIVRPNSNEKREIATGRAKGMRWCEGREEVKEVEREGNAEGLEEGRGRRMRRRERAEEGAGVQGVACLITKS